MEYLSVFSPNAEKHEPEKLQIWTVLTQSLLSITIQTLITVDINKKDGIDPILTFYIHIQFIQCITEMFSPYEYAFNELLRCKW